MDTRVLFSWLRIQDILRADLKRKKERDFERALYCNQGIWPPPLSLSKDAPDPIPHPRLPTLLCAWIDLCQKTLLNFALSCGTCSLLWADGLWGSTNYLLPNYCNGEVSELGGVGLKKRTATPFIYSAVQSKDKSICEQKQNEEMLARG